MRVYELFRIESVIQTLDAKPSAYSAVLKGQYKGKEDYVTIGFEYSYFSDFPDNYTQKLSTDGKSGIFTLEATKIVDLTNVYYRAFATNKEKTIYGETKNLTTRKNAKNVKIMMTGKK